MPRFFFHTQDGICVRDEDGEVLKDARAARSEALAVFGEILRYQGKEFFETGKFSVIVTDEAKAGVFTLTASIQLDTTGEGGTG